jgi:hypothetical protein
MSHRKGGFLYAFTKLTKIEEQIEARPSYNTTSSILPFPAPRNQRAGSLQNAFTAAVLAELPTEPHLILENKYPALRSLRTDADIGDGLWICCHCHHENILRHWKGPFPFKYLHCDRCDRLICKDCHSFEILTSWPRGMITAYRTSVGQDVRYCHVCMNCGLSHRAELEGTTLDFYGVTCAGCKTSSSGNWSRYFIGSVEPYRRDPDSSFVKLVLARADDGAKLSYIRDLADPDSRSVSRLTCTNPG